MPLKVDLLTNFAYNIDNAKVLYVSLNYSSSDETTGTNSTLATAQNSITLDSPSTVIIYDVVISHTSDASTSHYYGSGQGADSNAFAYVELQDSNGNTIAVIPAGIKYPVKVDNVSKIIINTGIAFASNSYYIWRGYSIAAVIYEVL